MKKHALLVLASCMLTQLCGCPSSAPGPVKGKVVTRSGIWTGFILHGIEGEGIDPQPHSTNTESHRLDFGERGQLHSSSPVTGARIYLAFDTKGHQRLAGFEAVSDEKGFYMIPTKGIPKPRDEGRYYHLIVEREGFERFEEPITLGALSSYQENTVVLKELPKVAEPGVITDKQTAQGAWQAVSVSKNGKSLTDDEVKRIKLIVKGDTHTWEDGTRRFDAEFKLDPEAEPKALDEKYVVDGVNIEHLGIYRIDGDRFEFCLNTRSSNLKRPTDFLPKSDRMCYVFRREKP